MRRNENVSKHKIKSNPFNNLMNIKVGTSRGHFAYLLMSSNLYKLPPSMKRAVKCFNYDDPPKG